MDTFPSHGEALLNQSSLPLLQQNFGNITYYQPDGTERIARLNTFPLDVDTSIGIARDVTDEQATEIQLRRAQKMDAVGQMAGGIAHDFNNILGIILGNLELLKNDAAENDKILKRADTINKSAQRAADLTNQLLDFSRQQVTRVEKINVNVTLEEMKNLITRSVTPGVEIEYQFTKDLWFTAVDPGDFHDALLNLTLNARDAMERHGHLLFKTRNRLLNQNYCIQNPGVHPGKYVQLSVDDSGEGIPPDLLDRVFEPFFTTKPQGKGTGLGLSMIFAFVKRSKGHIKIKSELGVGTSFNIFLPRCVNDSRV